MSFMLPKVRIGEPLRYEALSVFPLYSDGNGSVEYRLSEEAIASEAVTVKELKKKLKKLKKW